MPLTDSIREIIERIIAESDTYLVDVLVSDSKIRKKITVFVDSDAGILVDECSRISQELGVELDEIIEIAYVLEVSSPGADTPLKLERQYKKNIGRSLKVTTLAGEEFKGELTEVGAEEFVIQPEKKKKIIQEPQAFKYTIVKEAKVIISFK